MTGKTKAFGMKKKRKAAPRKNRQFVTALARGLDVLRCFSPARPELGSSEIAKLSKLPQPTVWRLCYTLKEMGFLTQPSGQEKFRLGIPVLGLGYAVLAGNQISEIAKSAMQKLAEEYQGAVSLGARDGLDMILLQRCQGNSVVLSDLRVGSRIPLASSATGWAYIAALSAEERELLLAELGRNEPDRRQWRELETQLRTALKAYSHTGYMINIGLLHSQINAVAVPVISAGYPIKYTISSGGIGSLFDQKKLHEIGSRLLQLANDLGSIVPATLSSHNH